MLKIFNKKYHFHHMHRSLPVLSLQRDKQQRQTSPKFYYNNGGGKNGKSKVSNICNKIYSDGTASNNIKWLLKYVMLQLMCISITQTQTVSAATPSNILIAAAPVIQISSRETTLPPIAEGTLNTFIEQQKLSTVNHQRNGQQSSFSNLDKEVGMADII